MNKPQRVSLESRHPGFTGPSAALVRQQILAFRSVVPVEFPAIRELIEQGFDPRFDHPPNAADGDRSTEG